MQVTMAGFIVLVEFPKFRKDSHKWFIGDVYSFMMVFSDLFML